jgi:hypothetical protein
MMLPNVFNQWRGIHSSVGTAKMFYNFFARKGTLDEKP